MVPRSGTASPTSQPSPMSVTKIQPLHTASAIAQSSQEHPRASFLGLPPEMRLRIYGFLVNGGRNLRPASDGYQCITSCYDYDDPYSKCLCTEPVWPRVLATNSVVFAEAMPVLYSTTEFHVPFPTEREIVFGKVAETDATRSRVSLCKLPTYGVRNIRRLALCASIVEMTLEYCKGEGVLRDISAHWRWLESLNLKLTCVRLHVDAIPKYTLTCRHFDVTPYIGLFSISRAGLIILQVPLGRELFPREYPESEDNESDYSDDEEGFFKNILREKFVSAFRTEANKVDYGPKIVDISDDWLEHL